MVLRRILEDIHVESIIASVFLQRRFSCKFLKMSIWSTLNRGIFKRTSTFFLTVAAGTFFFERTFDLVSVTIFESINKGKLWKDIKDNYQPKAEE